MDEAIERELRAYGRERGFRADTLERWIGLPPEDAEALWELTREMRLGENQLRDLWEWAEEIAVRDHRTLAAVLASEPLRAARRSAGGRNERLKAFKADLRRLRFPSLAKAEERAAALIANLDLPAGVRLHLPDFFEGDHVRAELIARDAAGLAAAARRLAAAAATPACEEIFELLSEAPDSTGSD